MQTVEAQRSSQIPALILLAGIALITTAIYWPGLHGPFLFDDWDNFRELFRWIDGSQSAWQVLLENRSGTLGRPVSMATFLINGMVFGSDTFGFKLGNLLIHLACGGAIFVLAFRLYSTATAEGAEEAHTASWFALTVSAIWLVHPFHVSTVLYSVQRMAQLSTLFTVLGLVAYIHFRTRLQREPTHRNAAMLFVAPGVLGILALLSKENGVLLPLGCLLLELCLYQGSRPLAAKLFAAISVFAYVMGSALLWWIRGDSLMAGYLNRDFTLNQRLLTEPRIIFDYLRSILAPRWESLTLFHDDFPPSSTLWSPPTTIVSIIGISALLFAALRFRTRYPLACLGVLFFFAMHLLESTLLPLELYFEHRNYLPSIGIVLTTCSLIFGIARIQRTSTTQRKAAMLSLGVWFGYLLLQTFPLIDSWTEAGSLYRHTLSAHPGSNRARLDYALLLERSNGPAAALDVLAPLLEEGQQPANRFATFYAMSLRCQLGHMATRSELEALTRMAPAHLRTGDLSAFQMFARLTAQRDCGELSSEAVAQVAHQWLLQSSDAEAHGTKWQLRFLAAQVMDRNGQEAAAVAQLSKAWSGGAAHAAVGGYLASLLMRSGRYADARAILEQVSNRLDSNDVIGRQNLVSLQQQLQIAEQGDEVLQPDSQDDRAPGDTSRISE